MGIKSIDVKQFLFGLFGAGFVFFTPFVVSLGMRGLLLVVGITLMMMAAKKSEVVKDDRLLHQ
jgi:hypothetical protein